MKTTFLCILLAAASVPAPAAENNPAADKDWARIEVLAKGPGAPDDSSPEAVVSAARGHLGQQEKALSGFIAAYPNDSRRYEAELQLASVSAALGVSLSDQTRIERAIRRLGEIEHSESTPAKVRADAAFQRITTSMQTISMDAAGVSRGIGAARNTILDSANNFAAVYPDDRRAARLLAEVATLFDDVPDRKQDILQKASMLAKDEGTRQRIRDDQQRLKMLGQPQDISFPTVQGGNFSLAASRGRPTILVFWAGWSPPSVVWLSHFAAQRPAADKITVATVSLDRSSADCRKTLEALKITDWPTQCDGRGWDNTVARKLGINALPTVFVFDGQGKLRSLNARDNWQGEIRRILVTAPGAR